MGVGHGVGHGQLKKRALLLMDSEIQVELDPTFTVLPVSEVSDLLNLGLSGASDAAATVDQAVSHNGDDDDLPAHDTKEHEDPIAFAPVLSLQTAK
ncbi:hypothetical protein GN956_G10761 [Arapaima gigas]